MIVCKKHPRYKGFYPPRVNCTDCWKVYREAQDGLEERNRRDRERTFDDVLLQSSGE